MLLIRSFAVTLGLILLWQVIVRMFQFPDYILPSPVQVLNSFINNFSLILMNAWPTLLETVGGLTLGVFFGSLLAITIFLIPWLGFWLLPMMIMSQAIPSFAVAPILVLWFGYGMASKIATITLMLFFPVASALYYGLQKTPLSWLDQAKSMNGKPYLILWHVQLPAARISLENGIRIAVALAPIGAIISEWIGASRGLGFLMLNANARLQIDLMFACLITIMILSLSLYGVINFLIRD